MLQPVEVLPGARRALRRAVHLECAILSELWDEPVPHLVSDLSPYGLFAETPFPLELGTEVLVGLTPPGWHGARELVVCGSVRRVIVGRRRNEDLAPGMGIVFEDLRRSEMRALADALRGLPPPLPSGASAPPREMLWVDVLAA
jgi:hypothetical protein